MQPSPRCVCVHHLSRLGKYFSFLLLITFTVFSCTEPIDHSETLQYSQSEQTQVSSDEAKRDITDGPPQALDYIDRDHCRCFMRIDNIGGFPGTGNTFTLADVTYGVASGFELEFNDAMIWWIAGVLPVETFPFPTRFVELQDPSAGIPQHMFYLGNGITQTLGLSASTTIRCFGDMTSAGDRIIDAENESPMREFTAVFRYTEENEEFPGLSVHFTDPFTCFDDLEELPVVPIGG